MQKFEEWFIESVIINASIWGVLAVLHVLFDLDAAVEAVGNWVLS